MCHNYIFHVVDNNQYGGTYYLYQDKVIKLLRINFVQFILVIVT